MESPSLEVIVTVLVVMVALSRLAVRLRVAVALLLLLGGELASELGQLPEYGSGLGVVHTDQT